MLSRLVREAASRHRQGPVLAYLQITRSFSLATGQEAPPLDGRIGTDTQLPCIEAGASSFLGCR